MSPTFLYHYTSIETLIYILKNRTIRFNNLNQVDDLNEGKSEDFRSIGNYFLVSCWTGLEEESIPFWNMYTDKMTGVRIKLPSDLFNTYTIFTNADYGLDPGAINSIVPPDVTFGINHWIVPTHNNFLKKVEYTDDKVKLKPALKTIVGNQFTIHLDKIGIYKATHWAFQSEWRYIIKVFPFASEVQNMNNGSNLLRESLLSINRGDSVPFSHLDITVNEEKFKQMEIILGPKSSEADKIIVESLVEKFNPTAIVKNSDLKGTIR